MAYASLVSLQQTTDLILNHDRHSLSDDEREQITSIREYLNFLVPFLEGLPEKGNRLESKIRDLANEAEDVIENLMWNQFWINWWSVGLSRVEHEEQLKRVREEIGSITGDVMDNRPTAVSSSKVAATIKIDVVVGLDNDLLEIKDQLRGGSFKLQVISIVGMGGIGKTTLAQKAYDDPLIIDYFDIRVWVTVPQDYSVDEILSRLGMMVSEELLEKNEASMAEKVYKRLKGRRYLIVMDDIWCTNFWDNVRNIFPDDKNGSRIMLTTRLSDVAASASSGGPVHEMKFIDENQSWILLKEKVFSDDQDCPPELEEVGKEIAEECGGLPLAVVLVAGILSTEVKTLASWEKIAENVNSVVNGQLDHNIHVSTLIKLWIADGFLKHQNEHKRFEEEAEEYLEDLVRRSLVPITNRKSNGNIKSCRLHDLEGKPKKRSFL